MFPIPTLFMLVVNPSIAVCVLVCVCVCVCVCTHFFVLLMSALAQKIDTDTVFGIEHYGHLLMCGSRKPCIVVNHKTVSLNDFEYLQYNMMSG